MLLLGVVLFMLFNSRKIDAIHAHGLNAAFITRIVNLFFKKRSVLSIHAIYGFPGDSIPGKGIRWIAEGLDVIMPLAQASRKNLIALGIPELKLKVYTQWVNLDSFRVLDKNECRSRLDVKGDFFVLFVGRLIQKKGADILMHVAIKLPQIKFMFVGDGPMLSDLKQYSCQAKNIYIMGKKNQDQMPFFYGASDVVVVPSQYEEGFARVTLEALFSGRPVVASRKGCLPEMISEDVGVLLDPTVDNITRVLNELFADRGILNRLSGNARDYAYDHFSPRNAQEIVNTYNC